MDSLVTTQSLLNDLEGRLAGVMNRFFESKKDAISFVALRQKDSVDPDLLELSVATNALLLQLTSAIVLVQRKTGKRLEDIVSIENAYLKDLVLAAKDVRDATDLPIAVNR